MTDRYEPLDLTLTRSGASWRDAEVRYHGADEVDRAGVWPGRRVLDIPGRDWPYPSPEECGRAGDLRGEWVLGYAVLVCPGCGLDCT